MRRRNIWAVCMTAFLCIAPLGAAGCGTDAGEGAYQSGVRAYESKDYAYALECFDRAVSGGERVTEGYRAAGIVQMKLKKYDRAAKNFESALERYDRKSLDSFREDVMFYLAEAYVNLDRTDDALRLYKDLLGGSREGLAYLKRGELYAHTQDFDSAAEDFDKAIKRDIGYAGYLDIYHTYVEHNRQADGALYLSRAMKTRPKSADDSYLLGQIYYEMGDADKAKEYLEEAIGQGVREASILMGRICLDTRDVARARKTYESCLKETDTKAMGYNGLALCDMAEEDYQSARANIESGMELQDDSVMESLMFNEIVVCERQKDFETAKKKIETFLKIYPDNETAIRESRFLSSR